ncbi:hypothetical protein EUGRSUZ_C01296 [Eucalyptus grandis]|uniref:Uncharacterized protein n=2 Tax=Eucalyptus grandis TaxID=71139 RepID=A0ACC3LEA7_EUCGR|nr:hypothetical protein EUGRSUZ_C01296 [Eucalyptus grandis]
MNRKQPKARDGNKKKKNARKRIHQVKPMSESPSQDEGKQTIPHHRVPPQREPNCETRFQTMQHQFNKKNKTQIGYDKND